VGYGNLTYNTDYFICFLVNKTMTSRDTVSLRDIYEAVERVEEKMTKRIEKVETDVNVLQGFQNRALGVVGVVSLFASAIASFIWEKIVGGK
jgi:hypothetical protein